MRNTNQDTTLPIVKRVPGVRAKTILQKMAKKANLTNEMDVEALKQKPKRLTTESIQWPFL